MNVLYFKKVFSSKEIKELSGSHKKVYKLLLVEVFHNIMFGKDNNTYFLPIYEYLKDLKEGCYTEEDCKQKIEEMESKITNEVGFALIDNKINEYIEFGRKRFDEIEKYGLSAFTKEEIEKFYPSLFHNNIEEWGVLDLNAGIGFINPVHTAFNDLKVTWNQYISLKKEIKERFFKCDFVWDIDTHYADNNIRKIHYTYGAIMRQLIFLVVTVVESYLSNSIMHISKSEINEYSLQNIIQNSKLKDTQIVEDILCVIQPELKNKIEKNYLVYKEINRIRNKYVHISTRIDKFNNKYPVMFNVMTLDKMNIPNVMNECLKLMIKINDEFFMKRGVDLLVWYKYKNFDFESMKKIEL